MARIRSIHPSFFTDEACVSCSPLARLLYVGLWCDADDQGVFEWRPLQLKMRLLPGDLADAVALLAELKEAGLILDFQHDGKPFGLVAGFRRFQRPKKPNKVHFLPPEYRTYVGLDGPGSVPAAGEGGPGDPPTPTEAGPVPHQSPTEGEKPPQMEDGGWREGERRGGDSARKRGARLPEDWQPSEVDRAFAAGKGFKALEIEHMALRFRNHWVAKSGRDACKLDWPRTWQNWVLSDLERRPAQGPVRAKVW